MPMVLLPYNGSLYQAWPLTSGCPYILAPASGDLHYNFFVHVMHFTLTGIKAFT